MTDDANTPEEADAAPGWDAISGACAGLHGDQEAKHWGTIISFRLGGPDPLDGVSAYEVADPPHFHYVTYGFSELYSKESDDAEHSGWGFELTFRLARGEDDHDPPVWPVNLLQNLARYVFGSGNVFSEGDYLPLNGPIAAERETLIHSALFAQDPRLPPIDTPHGRLAFIQLIGVTDAERLWAQAWNTLGVVDVLARDEPLLLTNLGRSCRTEDPSFVAAAKAGRAADGSRTGVIHVDQLSWKTTGLLRKKTTLTIGALAAPGLGTVLPGRIPHERGLALLGEDAAVQMVPGPPGVHTSDDGVLAIGLTPMLAEEISEALVPRRGEYTFAALPGFVLEVVPTEIKDRDGNVVETVG